jgi:hypothetical protein
MIKLNEFYLGYAGVPLSMRSMVVDYRKSGLTLSEIYRKIKDLDDRKASLNKEIEEYLQEVNPVIKKFL